MAIRITSKKNGFRRCGIEHPDQPVIYPDGTFTEEQIKALENEPMLIVEMAELADDQKKAVNPVAGLNAKDAAAKIEQLGLDELELVLLTDDRSSVKQAATKRIEKLNKIAELQKGLEEAQNLPDGPDKEKAIQDINSQLSALS